LGQQDCLYLGNLDAQRDWGHARDYVKCMWLMLQQEKADDFVIATGTTTRVRTFVEMAFAEMGIPLVFSGEGVEEIGTCMCKGELKDKVVVRVSERYFRPSEVELLLGDPTKAKTELGWDPLQTTLAQLVKEMVHADFEMASNPRAYLKF
jgi:GDPmannose 4,6-dehydratase